MSNERWTVVQHSGYGYSDNPQFQQGLETRECGAKEAAKVEKVGGILFDSYGDAEDFAMKAMYPDGDDAPLSLGILPNAQGTFSDQTVDGLRIYVPVRKVVG